MHIRSIRTLLFTFAVLCLSTASFAQIGIAITIGPPPLPVYEQPLCPGEGYIWTPGYWAYDYDIDDYYWVPGTWVLAPEVGFLWTPAYWGWGGDRFIFHEGYWGPRVGFYGGINYGFGYFGDGYEGGRWDHDHFFYNRSVNNINITNIHNVYNTTVINNNGNRVSYNGGNGGIDRRPRPEEEAAARERHIAPVADQTRQVQEARSNPQQRASMNMGRPAVAATPRPGNFKDKGVVAAREAGGPYTPPAKRGGNQPRPDRPGNNVPRPTTAAHPRDLPPMSRPSPPNTGNAKLDQKYQQQQEKQFAKQQQERDKLQQKQEQEHQRLAQQNANEAKRHQVEQRHQQQTQQLQQKHQQQQQKLQQKQAPASSREKSKPPR